jgi:hypothetical protein
MDQQFVGAPAAPLMRWSGLREAAGPPWALGTQHAAPSGAGAGAAGCAKTARPQLALPSSQAPSCAPTATLRSIALTRWVSGGAGASAAEAASFVFVAPARERPQSRPRRPPASSALQGSHVGLRDLLLRDQAGGLRPPAEPRVGSLLSPQTRSWRSATCAYPASHVPYGPIERPRRAGACWTYRWRQR